MDPAGVDPVKGINLKGLLALQHVMIVRGRMETIWGSLRAFGYTNSLELAEEFVTLPAPLQTLKPGESLEISAPGRSFIISLFGSCSRVSRYSSAALPAVAPSDVEKLFSVIPEAPFFLTSQLGFPESLPLVDGPENTKVLDRTAWDALWTLMALVDPLKTFQYLNLLGYEPPQGMKRGELMQLGSSTRFGDSVKKRTSFLCYVVGAPRVGKTSLLRRFAKHPLDTVAPAPDTPECAINAVDHDWLSLRSFGTGEKSILESEDALDRADCVAVCFDVSEAASWQYSAQVIEGLQKRFPGLPLTVVATFVEFRVRVSAPISPLLRVYRRKADSPAAVKTQTVVNARRFARSRGINVVFSSVVKDNVATVWPELVKASLRRRANADASTSSSSTPIGRILVATAAALVGIGALGYVAVQASRRGFFDKLPGLSATSESKK